MRLSDLASEVRKTASAALPGSETPAADADRRRERRVETALPVAIRTVSGDKIFPAAIRDCSAGGLAIALEQRLAVGETVIIEWNHGFLIGTVRHSRPGRNGWITGIALEKMNSQQRLIAEMVASERNARLNQLL